MYAIMFGDNQIVKIDCTNEDEFKTYKQVNTFDKAKLELIDYWDKMIEDARKNKKDAIKMRKPYS